MCIKIVKSTEEISYDTNRSLEEQLKGSNKVVINYEPKDPSIDHFLDEVERLCKNGITANLNIQFNHNNHLKGAKVKKEIIKLSNGMDLNEIIKFMTLAQSDTDKKLEEMAEFCFKR